MPSILVIYSHRTNSSLIFKFDGSNFIVHLLLNSSIKSSFETEFFIIIGQFLFMFRFNLKIVNQYNIKLIKIILDYGGLINN